MHAANTRHSIEIGTRVIDRAARPLTQSASPSPQASGWLLAAIVAVGTVLRVVSINTRSMWLDETTAVRQASWSINEMLAWMANNVHPPLFHTLLHYWLQVVGRSEIEVRSFALLWGIAAIPLMYWAGITLYDRRVALVASAVLALSPFFVWYSQEARMYTMMLVFSLLATVALWKALESPRKLGWWALYTVAAAAGIMTQYFTAFVLIGQAYYVVRTSAEKYAAIAAENPDAPKRRMGRAMATLRTVPELRHWLAASAAALTPLAWWLPKVLSHPELLRGTSGAFNYGGVPPKLGIHFNELILVPVEAVFGFHAETVMRNLVSMWPLLITLVFLSAGMARRLTGATRYLASAGVFGAAVIIALGQWQPIILEVRYFTAVAAPVVLLLARFICELKPRAFKLMLVLLVVGSIGLWTDQSYNPDSIVKWDNRQAMAFVSEGVQTGDTILLVPNFVSSIPEYYLPAEAYANLRKVPTYDVKGMPRNSPVQLAQDLERQVGPSHRVWIIATWQETPLIKRDANQVAAWLRSQDFRVVEDRHYRKIRVTLYETDPNREFFINPGTQP